MKSYDLYTELSIRKIDEKKRNIKSFILDERFKRQKTIAKETTKVELTLKKGITSLIKTVNRQEMIKGQNDL